MSRSPDPAAPPPGAEPLADPWADLEPAGPETDHGAALRLLRRAASELRGREAAARELAACARACIRQASDEVEAARARADAAEARAEAAEAEAAGALERARVAGEAARLAEARAAAAEARAGEAFRWVRAVHDAVGERPQPPRIAPAPPAPPV